MWKRAMIALNLGLVSVLAWTLVGQGGASGATVQFVNLAAPSFVGRDLSVHNDGNAVPPDACAAQVPLTPGEENRGDLQNTTGSFFAFVRLQDAATVTGFSLFANDADMDYDSAAYLIRKRITGGLSPAKGGYTVMAEAHTSGAVTDTLRKFSDSTIGGAVVDNSRFMYYVELVSCAKTVEPFAAQVVTSA